MDKDNRGGGAACGMCDILPTTTAFDEWLLLPERKKRSQMMDDLISHSYEDSLLQPPLILGLLTVLLGLDV